VIEKRRRDRINNSLSELRRLVPAAFEKQVIIIIITRFYGLSSAFIAQLVAVADTPLNYDASD